MKGFILTSVLVVVLCVKTLAQAPPGVPQIVISPQLFQPLSNMDEMQKRLEAVRKSASIISTLRSIQKFVSVLEQTNCTTLRMFELITQLELYGSSFLQTCEFEIRYNAGVYGLNSAVDMTNTMLAALDIEPGDRIKIALETMDKYAHVQGDLLELNKELEEQVALEENKLQAQKEYKIVTQKLR